MDALGDAAKNIDTSGKSAALVHHRAICRTSIALPSNGLFGPASDEMFWFRKAAHHRLRNPDQGPAWKLPFSIAACGMFRGSGAGTGTLIYKSTFRFGPNACIDELIEPFSPDKLRGIVTRKVPGRSTHEDPLPRPNGLSEVRSELVLELYGSLRASRRQVSGGATRPDHSRRHAAEALGHPSRQPYHRAFYGS